MHGECISYTVHNCYTPVVVLWGPRVSEKASRPAVRLSRSIFLHLDPLDGMEGEEGRPSPVDGSEVKREAPRRLLSGREARGCKAKGAAPSTNVGRIWPPATHVGTRVGGGGDLRADELSGNSCRAQSRVCGACAAKPRLWIYEKNAMAPQPESGLALLSLLEGDGPSSGEGLAEYLSPPHPSVWAS